MARLMVFFAFIMLSLGTWSGQGAQRPRATGRQLELESILAPAAGSAIAPPKEKPSPRGTGWLLFGWRAAGASDV